MSNSEIDNLLKSKTITTLSTSLPKNIKTIKNSIGNSNDIIIREFLIGKPIEVPIAIIYTDGLADKTSVTDFILESIMVDFGNIRYYFARNFRSIKNILLNCREY